MKSLVTICAIAIGLGVSACRKTPDPSAGSAGPPVARSSLRGHVHVIGPVPENDAIRMSSDPMCNKANGGQRVLDEGVEAAADGSLANVFVELVGNLPETPVPAEPVSIDQRGCVYRPRVIGIRAGQVLGRNSDDGLATFTVQGRVIATTSTSPAHERNDQRISSSRRRHHAQ